MRSSVLFLACAFLPVGRPLDPLDTAPTPISLSLSPVGASCTPGVITCTAAASAGGAETQSCFPGPLLVTIDGAPSAYTLRYNLDGKAPTTADPIQRSGSCRHR